MATPTADPVPPDGETLPPLLRKLMAEHAVTGLPPAYLPPSTDPESEPTLPMVNGFWE